MLVSIVMVVSCILLLIQCLGFYELIPLWSLTMLGQDNMVVFYIHSCICKWGLPFAFLGLILGLLCVFDKNNKFDLRPHLRGYCIFFVIVTILSFL